MTGEEALGIGTEHLPEMAAGNLRLVKHGQAFRSVSEGTRSKSPAPPQLSWVLLQPGLDRILIGLDPLLGGVFRRHAVDINHGGSRRDLRVAEVNLLQNLGCLRPLLTKLLRSCLLEIALGRSAAIINRVGVGTPLRIGEAGSFILRELYELALEFRFDEVRK